MKCNASFFIYYVIINLVRFMISFDEIKYERVDFQKTKEKVINILKEKIKNKELTVLYFTHNVEDSLYSDDIIILDNKNVLDYGSKEEIYQNEDLFNTAHLELPFIVDLSKKLQFYNMIDHDYFSMEKMVNDLWK